MMKNYNEEYFYLTREGDNYPLLSYVTNNFGEGDKVIPLDEKQMRIVVFTTPEVENPELADFHYIKQHVSIISERLKKVLESQSLKDVQFLPTIVRDYEGNDYTGFYILHVYNTVECMDRERSEWEEDPFSEIEGEVGIIGKLVLDSELLEKTPLDQRLVFVAEEERTHLLFHESIVRKILEINPTGLAFNHLPR
ncbi:MAG: imm11 family protein [Coprobacillaceae bacterium]